MNSESIETHKIKKSIKIDNNVIKHKNLHINDTKQSITKKSPIKIKNVNVQDIIFIPKTDI